MINRRLVIVGHNWLYRQGLKPVLRRLKMVVIGEGDDVASAFQTVRAPATPDIVLLMGHKLNHVAASITTIHHLQSGMPNALKIVMSEVDWTQEDVAAFVPQADAILSSKMSAKMLTNALELVMTGHRVFAGPAETPISPTPTLPSGIKVAAKSVKIESLDKNVDTKHSTSSRSMQEASQSTVAARPARAALTVSVPTLCLSPLTDQTFPPRLTGASPSLSVRERQILRCLVRGHPNKVIARELEMAETTVKVHIKSLLRKLRAANRTQAAIWAMNNGQIVDPEEEVAPAPRERLRVAFDVGGSDEVATDEAAPGYLALEDLHADTLAGDLTRDTHAT